MKIYLFLFFLLLAGCATGIPGHNFIPLNNNINNASVCRMIDKYNDSVLQKATILSSINFRFRGRTMSALGITKFDGENKNFSVAGLNPMAVTLFKLKMENGKLISSYVIPRFGKGHNGLDKAAETIGRDIARIYFNRKINPRGKSIKFDKYRIFIRKSVDSNSIDYVFSGNPVRLVEKIKYENKKKLWSVDYYDYKKINKNEIPFKIFLKNYKYGYTIDAETKQVKEEKHEPFK